MTPIQNTDGCSDSVILEANTSRKVNNLAQITATDQNTGQTLRSEAKVSTIQSLNFKVAFRQIYVSTNQKVTLIGLDEEGNIFSTLDGLRIDWRLDSGNEFVKVISLPEINSQEIKRTDLLFLKGLSVGKTVISARISEPGYERVPAVTINLSVVIPFQVEPKVPVYILPHSKYAFRLSQLDLTEKDAVQMPISLPHHNYCWKIVNGAHTVSDSGILESGISEGPSVIEVTDVQMPNNTAEASINVVLPVRLQVAVVDVSSYTSEWSKVESDTTEQEQELSGEDSHILIENHTYLLKMKLYDKNDNLITLTENVRFNDAYQKNYQESLENVWRDPLGSVMVLKVKPILEAKLVKLHGKFSLERQLKTETKVFKIPEALGLTQERQFILTKPVKILHSDILLPYLDKRGHEISTSQSESIVAVGGSGTFLWQVEDRSVAEVFGAHNLVAKKVRSKNVGSTVLTVRDFKNQANKDAIVIEVAQIDHLKWLEEQMEVPLETWHSMSLMAFDSSGRKFTNCTALGPTFSQKGNGLTLNQQDSDYEQIKSFIKESKKLVTLSQKFEDNPSAVFESQTTVRSKQIVLTNNFGICAQRKIKGDVEGLMRVKAEILLYDEKRGQIVTLESEFTEIVVFSGLSHLEPSYDVQVADLYAHNHTGQEFVNYKSFYKRENAYTLVFGSKLVWKVRGGSNYWTDYEERYSKNFVIKSSAGRDLKMQITRVQTAHFEMTADCEWPEVFSESGKPQPYNVTFEQQSNLTRKLLSPISHKIQLLVICEPPTSVRLLWSGTDVEFPRSRVQKNTRTHFVLVNSEHQVRYIVFGSQMVISHSSLAASVFTTHNQVSLTKSIQYDRRSVSFGNETGLVDLKVRIGGYYGSKKEGITAGWFARNYEKLKPEEKTDFIGDYQADIPENFKLVESSFLEDQLRVEIVNKVAVTPTFKSLYLGGTQFHLRINGGSGYFDVSLNNTRLVSNLIHKDRDIYFKPDNAGSLSLEIFDVEIPLSRPARALIVISDIKSMELTAPRTLLEEDDTIEMTITAFDLHNIPFSADQYQFMDFQIRTERMGISDPSGLSATKTGQRLFAIHGTSHGIYQVIASTYLLDQVGGQALVPYGSSEKIARSSKVLRVEVFPFLKISPNSLLLAPGMRYTLQIEGGPSLSQRENQKTMGSHIEMNFIISDLADQKIARVDNDTQEVVALMVGDATLQYEIVQLKTHLTEEASDTQESRLISKKTVPIRVRLPTGVEIHNSHQRQVYSRSYFKALVVLKYDKTETFTYGVGPISYDWNTTDSEVLRLRSPSPEDLAGSGHALVGQTQMMRDNSLNSDVSFYSSFNSSSVYLSAGKSGEGLLKVRVALHYPTDYKKKQNWFEAHAIIRVIEKLAIEVPEYSLQGSQETHHYMLPPQTMTRIESNKEIKLNLAYSGHRDAENPLISVSGASILTHNKPGKATIMVEDGQGSSDQIVMLNVIIEDIFDVSVMDSFDSLNMPLGTSLKFEIHFQNEHAHMFAKNLEGINLGVTLSHPKVVTAEIGRFSQTLNLTSHGTGECNVIIFLKDKPNIFDILNVRVTSLVRPASPVRLHLGGQVDFQLDGTNSKLTQWDSSNPQILNIDQISGKATGLSSGKVEVIMRTHPNAAPIIASIVHIGEVQHAKVNPSSDLLLQKKDQRIHIKFFLEKTNQAVELKPVLLFDGTPLVRHNVGIKCITEDPDFVKVREEVKDHEGFFCLVSQVTVDNKKLQPRFVTINVLATSNSKEVKSYQRQVTSFQVELTSQIMVDSQELQLTKATRQVMVRVFSGHDFTVKEIHEDPATEHLLWVTKEYTGTMNEYKLTVDVSESASHSFKAEIVLDSTKSKGKPVKLQMNFYADIDVVITASSESIFNDKTDQSSPTHSWQVYPVCVILFFVIVQFVSVNCFGVNFFTWLRMQYRYWNSPYDNRYPNEYERKRPVYGGNLNKKYEANPRNRNESLINSTGNSFGALYRPLEQRQQQQHPQSQQQHQRTQQQRSQGTKLNNWDPRQSSIRDAGDSSRYY